MLVWISGLFVSLLAVYDTLGGFAACGVSCCGLATLLVVAGLSFDYLVVGWLWV